MNKGVKKHVSMKRSYFKTLKGLDRLKQSMKTKPTFSKMIEFEYMSNTIYFMKMCLRQMVYRDLRRESKRTK